MSDYIIAAIITGSLGLIGVIFSTLSYVRFNKQAKEVSKREEELNERESEIQKKESMPNKCEANRINYSFESCNYIDYIKNATNSIFFSGIALSLLADMNLRRVINEKKDTSKCFIIQNFKNEELYKFIDEFLHITKLEHRNWRGLFEDFQMWIKEIKNKDSFYSNSFYPVSYFAVDYKNVINDTSFIQAKHYFSRESSETPPKVLYVTAYPNTDLYNFYREQILLIEMSAKSDTEKNVEIVSQE